ncbi:hypothetical protein CYMTET_27902 [Cymbomonas tetramitiformis]|uniref:Uncharacterized protein n=1 Tax=Cymbomonas tetramitiformis TaxID=36881 RepID=A0AAE0KWR1_9CHLO|nr:hypothetical protein CYMTET_27902 [Cymbomonas tetramitiformis]
MGGALCRREVEGDADWGGAPCKAGVEYSRQEQRSRHGWSAVKAGGGSPCVLWGVERRADKGVERYEGRGRVERLKKGDGARYRWSAVQARGWRAVQDRDRALCRQGRVERGAGMGWSAMQAGGGAL